MIERLEPLPGIGARSSITEALQPLVDKINELVDAVNSSPGASDMGDAIEAIQRTLGVMPQGYFETVVQRLNDIDDEIGQLRAGRTDR